MIQTWMKSLLMWIAVGVLCLFAGMLQHFEKLPTNYGKGSVRIPRMNATAEGVPLCSTSSRAHHIQQICKNIANKQVLLLTRESSKTPSVYVDDEYRILYCGIPKCGSTTVRYYMGQLHDPDFQMDWTIKMKVFNNVTGIRKFTKLSQLEQHRVLKEYFKFVVVRHPLDRLYSAWHNKLSKPNTSHIIQGNIKKIITEYLNEIDPSRKEFDVITTHVTFYQFLDLVNKYMHTGFRNPHWAGFYEHCQPCSINYDHVFRLETLSRDINALRAHVQSLNTSVIIPALGHVNNESKSNNKLAKLKTMLKDVNSETIQGIKGLFRIDFDMFGYEWHPDQAITCSYRDEACC